MISFILKRLFYFIPTLFLAAFLVFCLVHLIPGDPAVVMLGDGATPENVKALREALGLDQPLPVQFGLWVVRAVRGDLGVSIHTKVPVAESIVERFPVTLSLTVLAMIFSLILALPSGCLAAVYQNTGKDYLFMLASILGVSIPGFWLGLLALLIFSVELGWFPSTGFVSLREDLWQGFRFLLLPATTLGLHMAAVVARMTRSSMLEVLREEYVTVARAKGLSEVRVVYLHALRNALVPIVTVIGFNFGFLLAGSAFVETIFSWPGIGRLLYDSMSARDYPVIMGIFLVVCAGVIFANLLTDIAYAYLDPRVRYE